MTYLKAREISQEVKTVDPDFFDEQMIKAKKVAKESSQKIFTCMVEDRKKQKERINRLKSSVYTW